MEIRECKDCGKAFEISNSEIDFYMQKGINLPRRCKQCREINRQKKHSDEYIKIPKFLIALLLLLLVAARIWLAIPYDETNKVETSPYDETKKVEVSQTQIAPGGFRTTELRDEHYRKHGYGMGFSTAEAYEEAAKAVVTNNKSLHKIQSEDGDDVYYLQSTNEFVVVSTSGYIRTYFKPDDGIAYFNRQ